MKRSCELMNELANTVRDVRDDRLAIARRNESYGLGFQDFSPRASDQSLYGPWPMSGSQVRVRNYLGNLWKTFVARMTSDRPRVFAYPNTEQAERIGAAEVAQRFLDYWFHQSDFDERLSDAMRWATVHGVACLFVDYNPDNDTVSLLPLTVFDYVCEDVDDPSWVIHQRIVTKWDAAKIAGDPSRADSFPEVTLNGDYGDYATAASPRRGVLVRELYYKPCARFENGKYILEVGGETIRDDDHYPWVDNNNDIIWKFSFVHIDKIRGSHYSTTWVNDVIDVQYSINEIETSYTDLIKKTSKIYLIVPEGVQDLVNDSTGMISVPPDSTTQDIRFTQPAAPPSGLGNEIQRTIKQMYDIAGINEISVGAEQAHSGDSAKKIGYLAGLDAQKHQATAKSMHNMIRDIAACVLRIAQTYFDNIKIGEISGKSRGKVQWFASSDIDGVDVYLEEISGESRTRPAMAEAEINAVKQGIKTNEGLEEQALTGLPDSLLENYFSNAADDYVQRVMDGEDADPGIIPPATLEAAIMQRLSIEGLSEDQRVALHDLLGSLEQPEQPQDPEQGTPEV